MSKQSGAGEASGVLHAGFRDVDDFNETVRGWNLQFRQLERGPLDASLIQYQSRHANIASTLINRAIAQCGGPPPGMRTFGIGQERLPWMQWCGRDVKADAVLCFHPSSDFECLSPAGFAVFSLSLDEAQIAASAACLGHADFLEGLRVEQAVEPVDMCHLQNLRSLLHSSFSSRFMASATVHRDRARAQLEVTIADELVMLLAGTHTATSLETLATRSRALKAAIAYILDHAREPVSVGQVCEAARVSWRTLDRAFKERLGVSPKACINAVRLHGARQELKKADPVENVADIANSWGFWHMGSFAKYYRQAFNELPSQTLSK